jgi:quercetin dioxygenase-like cupin family protein
MASRANIRIALAASLLGTLLSHSSAAPQNPTVKFILPDSLKWGSTPLGADVRVAPVAGDPQKAGALYVLFSKYPPGAKSLPHTNSDDRIMTVLSGTFYLAVGNPADEVIVQQLGPASVAMVPANTPHYGWAKEQEVVLQEAGNGPSSTKLWPQTNKP